MKPICRFCERDIVLVSADAAELGADNDRACGAPPAPSRWKHVEGPAICVESWASGAPGSFAQPTLTYVAWHREHFQP